MLSQASFISDDPDSLSVDAFGHRDYADALVSILTGASPPPTVGVFGQWGVGKSTIIGAIQQRLQKTSTAFVYFDAWRYEGDSLRRQFLSEAARQLDKEKRLNSYDVEGELRELEVDTQELRETFSWSKARFKRAAVLGLGFAVIALIAAILGGLAALLGGNFGTKVLIALTVFAVTTLASALSQSVVVNPTTLTRRTLQDPDRFAKKFTTLLSALNTERVVFAIDNLDRCSPEKAVEMLGTIKTYLEPAARRSDAFPRSSATETAECDVVFVIAVDDAALRRHLIAQEQTRSAGQDAAAVRRYVEEYLAKFFNARLPIRQILGDDMRGYVEEQIGPLAKERGLGEEDILTLVSLVSAALRRNPRGVKQFRNDLESRLRLLEEREQKKDGKRSINPAVSGEVTMVAKLALIETEWPDAFARLQDDPRLLSRWTTQALAQTEVDWIPGSEDEPDADARSAKRAADLRTRRAFGDFLRLSATTNSDHLRAMLNLKQSQIEVSLPGYSEFRDAVINGDRDAVTELLEQAKDTTRPRLAARIPEFLRAELKSGYLDNARVIVGLVLSLEAFDSLESAHRDVLAVAVDDPALRGQLVSIDPAIVLAHAELLAPTLRSRLFEPYIQRLIDTNLSDHLRTPVAAALAPHTADFSPMQRADLVRAFGDPMKSELRLFLPLVRADPALLPKAATDAALAELEREGGNEPSPGSPPPLNQHPDALEVLEIGLRNPTLKQERRTVGLATRIVNGYAEQEEIMQTDLPHLERLLSGLETTDEVIWTDLARAIESRWPVFPGVLWIPMLALAELALRGSSESARDEVAANLGGMIFEEPALGLDIAAKLGTPPDSLRHPFIARLTTLSGQPAHWQAASEALVRIGGPDLGQWLVNAFHVLLSENHVDEAQQLFASYPKLFDEHSMALAESAVPLLVARINNDQATPVELLAAISEASSEEQLEQISAAYAERLGGPQGTAIPDVLDQLRRLGADRMRLSVAHRAVASIGNDPQPLPPPHLAVACRNVDVISPGDQRLLAAALGVRLRTHLDQAAEIAGNIATMAGLSAQPAKDLIDALIDAESAVGGPDARRALLSAANSIRGRSNSLATKSLRSRLGLLAHSDQEFDRELAEQFLALLED